MNSRKIYYGISKWIHRMRKAGITNDDISKIVGCSKSAVEKCIYGVNKGSYGHYDRQTEYINTYVKNLFKRAQSILGLNGDALIEYIADERGALFTKLGIIEKKLHECEFSEVKELASEKANLIKMLNIREKGLQF